MKRLTLKELAKYDRLKTELELNKLNHLLHFFLTLITGIWIIPWILVTISASNNEYIIKSEIAKLFGFDTYEEYNHYLHNL